MRFFTYRIIPLILWALGIGMDSGYAQPVLLELDEAVRRGLEHSASLALAEAQAFEARAIHRQNQASKQPSLNTLASYTRLSSNIPEISFSGEGIPGFDTTFTIAPIELNRIYSEINVEQSLFTGFLLHHRTRAAQHQARAATLDAAQEQANVALEVRQAYWRLYQAEAMEEAAREALAQIEAHLSDARRRRDAGSALESDVLSAQTRLFEVRLELVEVENAVQLARMDMNRLIGLPLETTLQLTESPDATPVSRTADDILAEALASQPALEALEERVASLEAQVSATQGAWFPSVALSGRYVFARPNQYFFTEQDQLKGTWEAGVVLRWNLWDGNARSAETQQARARLDGARAQLAAGEEQVNLEVMQRYLEARRAQASIEVAAATVGTAEETLRMIRQQYAEGAALATQVLDAEQTLRLARARHARVLADHAIASAALQHIMGKVW